MPLRSLLVDDSPHFLVAASELLERQGVDVVGIASTIEDAARLADALRPDVCLVDIDLGDESGFDYFRRSHLRKVSRPEAAAFWVLQRFGLHWTCAPAWIALAQRG